MTLDIRNFGSTALDLTVAPGDKTAQCSCAEPHLITEDLHQFSESLGFAIDAKDSFTSLHSDQVAIVARELALIMGYSVQQAEVIHVAGHLHDIGKIGIPNSILNKPGKLTDAEFSVIRTHPGIGAAIVRPVVRLKKLGIVEMVLHHHERWDGKGYPDQVGSTDISTGARIIALADSLSAMLQNRPYRPPLSREIAISEVRKNAGSQFDPTIAEAFLDEHKLLLDILEGVIRRECCKAF